MSGIEDAAHEKNAVGDNARHKGAVSESLGVVAADDREIKGRAVGGVERLRNAEVNEERNRQRINHQEKKHGVPAEVHDDLAADDGGECRPRSKEKSDHSVDVGRFRSAPVVAYDRLRDDLTDSRTDALQKPPAV